SIHQSMRDVTLRVILKSVFGLDEGPERARLERLLSDLLDVVTSAPLLLPFMQVDAGPWSPWGRYRRSTSDAQRILLEEVAERRRAGKVDQTDVLSLLLAARDEDGHPLTDAEVRDMLMTLLAAGHDTTASAIAWAVRWVFACPPIVRRIREEL